jgi:AraC-like DNA-binding protein
MEAETLAESLCRFGSAIPMHASYSTYIVEQDAGLAWVRYRFAVSSLDGYANLAFCGAGILIDYLRQYVQADWMPEVINFDLPRPTRITDIQDAFPCKLRFNAQRLGIGFDPAILRNRPRHPLPENRTTLADVSRARWFTPPCDLEGAVRELVRVQIRSRTVSLDAAARAIGLGTRRLQRALDREGLSFREITRSTRVQTAKELVTQTSLPISTIAAQLGYSAKGHFSRAFRRDVGCTPSEYRDRFVDAIGQPNALGSIVQRDR